MALKPSGTRFSTPPRVGHRSAESDEDDEADGEAPSRQIEHSGSIFIFSSPISRTYCSFLDRFRLPVTPDAHRTLAKNECQDSTTAIPEATHDTWTVQRRSRHQALTGANDLPPDSFDPSRDSASSQASSSTQRWYRAFSPPTGVALESIRVQTSTIISSTPKSKRSTRKNANGERLTDRRQSLAASLGKVPIASGAWLIQLLRSCQLPNSVLVSKWVHMKTKPAKAKKGAEVPVNFSDGRWMLIPETSEELEEAHLSS